MVFLKTIGIILIINMISVILGVLAMAFGMSVTAIPFIFFFAYKIIEMTFTF